MLTNDLWVLFDKQSMQNMTTKACKHVASELSNCGRALESELIIRKICRKLINCCFTFLFFLFPFSRNVRGEIVRVKLIWNHLFPKRSLGFGSFFFGVSLRGLESAQWIIQKFRVAKNNNLTPCFNETKHRSALWEWIDAALWRLA